jgi:hypothetical protein
LRANSIIFWRQVQAGNFRCDALAKYPRVEALTAGVVDYSFPRQVANQFHQGEGFHMRAPAL